MVTSQEAKCVESWPNTTSAWAGWSRFDIPVNRYGGVHSQLICTSSILGSPTCHWACQQENTYSTKYQKADRASTLVTLWSRAPRTVKAKNAIEIRNLVKPKGDDLFHHKPQSIDGRREQ
jgi:hypothetical protein